MSVHDNYPTTYVLPVADLSSDGLIHAPPDSGSGFEYPLSHLMEATHCYSRSRTEEDRKPMATIIIAIIMAPKLVSTESSVLGSVPRVFDTIGT